MALLPDWVSNGGNGGGLFGGMSFGDMPPWLMNQNGPQDLVAGMGLNGMSSFPQGPSGNPTGYGVPQGGQGDAQPKQIGNTSFDPVPQQGGAMPSALNNMPVPQMPSLPSLSAIFGGGQQQPGAQPRPQPGQPGIGDRLGAAGAGFFNAGSPMEAVGNLLGGIVTGQRQDARGQALELQKQAWTAAAHYVASDPTIEPRMKVALIQNPALAAQYLAAKAKPTEYKFEKLEQYGGAFNPQTGSYDIKAVAPKMEKLGDGDQLYSVNPGMPGGAAPSSSLVASGGPNKAPEGYQWVDPKNTSKGLSALPGGPATKLPENTAAYLAMMQSSRPGIEAAKNYFLSPSFKSGPMDAAGKAVGQATNSFEIGRHQRSIALGTEAALRMATGAAAPDTEVKRYADFYSPSVYDSEATRRQKLEALTRFMDFAQKNIGIGRVPPPEAFVSPESTGSMVGKPGERIMEWTRDASGRPIPR